MERLLVVRGRLRFVDLETAQKEPARQRAAFFPRVTTGGWSGLGRALLAGLITIVAQVPYYTWSLDKVEAEVGWAVSVIAIPSAVYFGVLSLLSVRAGYPKCPWIVAGLAIANSFYWLFILMWTMSGD